MIKICLSVFTTVLLVLSTVHAQDRAAGEWKGAINVMNQQLRVELTLASNDGTWSGSLNIPQQNAYGLPLSTTEVYTDSVYLAFQAGMTLAVFEGTFSSDSLIEGTFRQGINTFPFSLNKQLLTTSDEPVFPESDLLISAEDIEIGGTLINDETTSDKPLIILISGSGAQPRDVNVFGFEVFRTLAGELYEAGYPTFRYDDRQTGKSTGSFADATLIDLSADVEVIMNHFKAREEQAFDSFILLGHSQGGLIAGKLASVKNDVAGLILMASPGISTRELLAFQVRQAYEPTLQQYPDIVSAEDIDQEIRLREGIMAALKDGSPADTAIDAYNKFYADLLKKIMEASGQTNGNIETAVQRQAAGLRAAYGSPQMLSLLYYEPTTDLVNISVPALVLFGEKDTQVPKDLNQFPIESSLKKAGIDHKILTINSANHLFQTAESGQVSEYSSLDPAFEPAFIKELTDWLKENY
ncbi:alpha/beta fold hydrolase [Balneola sp. MJW-20]|uniref:alpha/beta fold hydrolase n=1 Tax=Gracilimonas aurantiaca TaxID=3234185 RepID=UPI0034674E22